MDWLEASKVSYYKNDEVQKIIDDINQRTNSQMRCCRRELATVFYASLANASQTFISIAMVMGPTPPGTGVIRRHFSRHYSSRHLPIPTDS